MYDVLKENNDIENLLLGTVHVTDATQSHGQPLLLICLMN